MLLSNYQLSKKKERLVLLLLFLISIFSRIPVIFAYGDTHLENEWAVIVNNLIIHNTFSFSYYNESLVVPSAFMPPMYAYYLYFFSFLNLEIDNYILLILSSQILLSSLSSYMPTCFIEDYNLIHRNCPKYFPKTPKAI